MFGAYFGRGSNIMFARTLHVPARTLHVRHALLAAHDGARAKAADACADACADAPTHAKYKTTSSIPVLVRILVPKHLYLIYLYQILNFYFLSLLDI
jgi:hypothetical protein